MDLQQVQTSSRLITSIFSTNKHINIMGAMSKQAKKLATDRLRFMRYVSSRFNVLFNVTGL